MKFKIIILILIVVVSCQISFPENKEYKTKLEKFPKELSSHFPKELTSSFQFYEGFNSKFSPTLFMSKVIYTKADFEKNIKCFDSLKKFEYKSNDNDLLVIDPYNQTENQPLLSNNNEKLQRQIFKSESYIPIPNFIEINGMTKNKNNLSDDFIIKVFQNEQNNNWKEFHNDHHWNLPIGLEDGASSGVAVNQNEMTIIYWLSIW